MPCKPRFNLIGIPQHVIQRGNNREPCIYAEADYRRYLDDLREVAEKYKCRIDAYVLMTNHVAALAHPCARGTCASLHIAYASDTDGSTRYFTNDAGPGQAVCVLH